MMFVYIHAVVFALWMLFVEKNPVADAHARRQPRSDLPLDLCHDRPEPAGSFASAKANHDFTEQETELKQNTELTRQIHALTTEIHASCCHQVAS